MTSPDHDAYARSLFDSFALREPAVRAAVNSLALPPGSHGLDAGCGVGQPAVLLAEAVGPAGRVTGLDLSPGLLAHARQVAGAAGLAHRMSFAAGSVTNLPFDRGAFDWAWSMDCVGYLPLAPRPLLRELARVVRPGGRVAILAWSSQSLLPGYPRLEARLNATAAGIAPFAPGRDPADHFLRALGWFETAGLVEARARTFAGDAHAPLSDTARRALAALLAMRWPGAVAELSAANERLFRRLTAPESPDFILARPDYHAFFTYTMFSGTVPD